MLLKTKCKTQRPGTREQVSKVISPRWHLNSKVNQTLWGLKSSKGFRKDRITWQPASYLVLILFTCKYKEIFPGKWYKFCVITWNKRRQKFSIREHNFTSRCWRTWHLWWQPRQECLVCSKSEALLHIEGQLFVVVPFKKGLEIGKASTLHWNHLYSQTRIQPRATNKKEVWKIGKCRLLTHFPLFSIPGMVFSHRHGSCGTRQQLRGPRCFILKGLYRCTLCCPTAARCTPWTSKRHKEQLLAKKCKDRFSCLILRMFFLALSRRGRHPGRSELCMSAGRVIPSSEGQQHLWPWCSGAVED